MSVSVFCVGDLPPLRNFRIELETTPSGVEVWWWNLATGEGTRVGPTDLTLSQAMDLALGVDTALRLRD